MPQGHPFPAAEPGDKPVITVIGLDGSELTPQKTARLATATLVIGAAHHVASVRLPGQVETAILGDPAAALDRADAHLSRLPGDGHEEAVTTTGIRTRPQPGTQPESHMGEPGTDGAGKGEPGAGLQAESAAEAEGRRRIGVQDGPGTGGAGEPHVVVLANGDPGLFGIVRAFRERGHRPEVLPGISSVALAFARAGLTWDDALVVSARGPAGGLRRAANACRAHPKVAVLTGPGAGPAEIARELAPTTPRTLIVCEDLGGENERVTRPRMGEATTRAWRDPNVLIVLDPLAERKSSGPGRNAPGPGWIAGTRPGPSEWALPEDAFDHRDSTVRNAEVRAFALAKLGPRVGDLVWDVGAGSGSMAIECARFGAAVIAVERDADACDRIRRNVLAHGVKVALSRGEAPAALEPLPDPDAVFVGGVGLDVIDACAARRPRVLVAAFASLERVPGALGVLRDKGYRVEGIQLQSSRLAAMPDGAHRLTGTDPVTVIWGTRAGGTRWHPPHG